jgi:mannose-6-phosphate isomerase-like protein (cupin superfamily)
MLSNTVEEGLKRYEIGSKVRALRLRKKMGLVELGRHTGFSAALLSKVESSKIFPPLGTLLRIAMVFGVCLDYFFTEPREKPVLAIVRKKDRMRFANTAGAKNASYEFESLDFPANDRLTSSYLAEFFEVKPERAAVHAHPGVETIYVISGRLAIAFGTDEHVLTAGDSIYFDSSVPHSYRRVGSAECRAVVVTAG